MKALLERFLGYLALMAALWILFFVLVALARLVERPLHEDRYKVSVPDSAVAQVATVHAQPPITQLGPQTTILCGPLRFPFSSSAARLAPKRLEVGPTRTTGQHVGPQARRSA